MWWKILLGLLAAILIGFFIMIERVGVTPGILLSSLFGMGTGTPEASTIRSSLKVPPGFSVGLYAGHINNARFIRFTRAGDLIVAQPRESRISLVMRDANGDGIADGTRVLMDNLVRPHSIDFHEGYLYIAESNAVGRVRFDHETGTLTGDYERIIAGLGDEGNHWTKTILFGPDGLLYLSAGSTCNVCQETDPMRAAITRYQPDGSGVERFATGLRNAVGMDFSPLDGHLYATDNGRDLLGDDYPPCELNRVEAGQFYGWPNVNGFGDPDPDFGDEAKREEAIPPVHGFRPHNAPLGIRFIQLESFPEEYRNVALVALHGSWNRSTYDGYKVVSLHPNSEGGYDERDFLSGFENNGDIIGRPVDVAAGPDGCVYVSDDYAMAIFRVCHGEEAAQAVPAPESPSLPGQPASTGLENYDPVELQALVAEGETLFRTRGCTSCHLVNGGKSGFGLKRLENLDDRYTVNSLRSFFKTPTPPMPPVRLDNEDQELALAAYLLEL
ncbi:MAG: PQQ-dependent sugar dehydrogenase [Proteobacteria bacterium]|nr:PQQ-dependent sugar dehydrogenase [Pseudomonadota bacterium]